MGLGTKAFATSEFQACVYCNCLGFGNLRGNEETVWREKTGISGGLGRRAPQGLEYCAKYLEFYVRIEDSR